MAEDWAIDVKKYAPDADDAVIAGIVRHCGIALRSRDASLVSFTDPTETTLVRESYCRKKLGLTHSDEELDAAIARVGERMKADKTKNRVTVYYLLAEMFGKLSLFGGAATAAAAAAPAQADPEPLGVVAPTPPAAPPPAAAPVPPAAPAAPIPPMASPAIPAAPVAAAAAAGVAAAPVMAARAGPARKVPPPPEKESDGIVGTALIALGILGLAILGTATVASLMKNGGSQAPVTTAAPIPIGPVTGPATATAIPQGSGVIAEDVAGQPKLSVYFDTASAEVTPDFAAAAAPIKAWVDSRRDARLAVSGYNDPRGDAAFNAALSKNRAQAVAAALVALGVPESAIDLEKPAETSDTTTSLENARRVDVVVKDGLTSSL